ncbi:D-beta-hydroxybutyrate dehydrogenase, mitochondrial-like [Rhinatrema bivittatum]|uniref:D-beta-hydroxybutyrate dehydrogenase, mitochondrial-like n=1 Tax=Rhinatrema bivittatum TaxID=194408 RepID=UPI001129CB52|nr:D-beta-hydroxybutyrate dehydrogenase, mitochondrial-like [Rhinatrema bivittatum]
MAVPALHFGRKSLLVLLSLVLTLALGMGLPEGLSFLARLFGFAENSVIHGIVLLYFLYVLYVAMPALPRGTVPVEDKHVLITGCDTGFGFALAKHLHAIGFTVFAGCLLKDKGGDGARELQSMQSDSMKVLQLNVTSDEEITQAVEFVRKNLKEPQRGLWGIVNNAGVSKFGGVEFESLDNYKEVADVNLWGTVRVTKAFLPLIRRAKGRVVNIASMLGRMASPSRSCYCISKYAVEAFSDCLRQEMYQWGVKVAVIEPSNFIAATRILTQEDVENQADELWKKASEIVQEDYGKEYFAHQIVLMKSFVNSGFKDMSPVLNDITDALSSKLPYTRYNPSDTYWWIRLKIMTHLPASIANWIYIR